MAYVFLIAGLRVLGKRELGQMSLYDLVMIIVLGNSVQNAMINNDNTLGGGLEAATVLLVLNRLLNELALRSKRVEHLMVGEPVLIVSDGALLDRPMKRQGNHGRSSHGGVGFRLFGNREMAQLSVYDLAMLFALGNVVQNAMTAGKGNLAVGLATSSAVVVAAWVLTAVLEVDGSISVCPSSTTTPDPPDHPRDGARGGFVRARPLSALKRRHDRAPPDGG